MEVTEVTEVHGGRGGFSCRFPCSHGENPDRRGRRHGAPADEARPGVGCRERKRDGNAAGCHPRFLIHRGLGYRRRCGSVPRQDLPSCRGKLPQRLVSRIPAKIPFPPWPLQPAAASTCCRLSRVCFAIEPEGAPVRPPDRPAASPFVYAGSLRDRAAGVGDDWLRALRRHGCLPQKTRMAPCHIPSPLPTLRFTYENRQRFRVFRDADRTMMSAADGIRPIGSPDARSVEASAHSTIGETSC
jgi:hypothetical protein